MIAYKATVFYDAGQTVYNFPFLYMKKEFVKAKYIKADGTAIYLLYNRDYQIANQTLTLLNAPPEGVTLLTIYRETPTDQQVRFVDASILKAYDLNTQGIQLLHIAEENTDTIRTNGLMYDDTTGTWHGMNRRLSNLADPVNAHDAVTLRYLNEVDEARVKTMKEIEAATLNAKDIAVAAKNEAIQAAIRAKEHEEQTVFAKQDAEAAAEKAKNEAITSEEERHKAARFAQIAREWADFPGAPAGEAGCKSSKTWAEEAAERAHEAETYEIYASDAAATAKVHRDEAVEKALKATQAQQAAEAASNAAHQYKNDAESSCDRAEEAVNKALGFADTAGEHSNSANRARQAAEAARDDTLAARDDTIAARDEAAGFESGAALYELSARKSAAKAKNEADNVAALLTNIQTVNLFNPTVTYTPGMCAMLLNGDVYRCIKTCQGIIPGTDEETHWVKINTKHASVFENEVVYKYIPRPNLSQPVPYQYFTAPKKGYYQFIIIGGGGHGSRGYLENGVALGGNGGGGGCLTQRTLLLQQGERLQFLVGGGCPEDTGIQDNSLGGEMTRCTIEETDITYYGMGGANGSKTVVGYGSILNPFAPPSAPFPHSDYSGMNGSAGQCVPLGLRALGGTGGASLFAIYGAGGRGGNVESDGQLENGQKGLDGCAIVRY